MIDYVLEEFQKDDYRILDVETSKKLDNFLCSLPWQISGMRLDWDKINFKHKEIKYKYPYEINLKELKELKCFKSGFCILLFSAYDSCIKIKTDVVINNLQVFTTVGSVVYFFNEENINKFVEFDSDNYIVGTI